MKNNIEKLENWYNQICNYEKLNFNDAKKLYIEIINEEDTLKKDIKRNKLIEGTLYVVYNFVKKNVFCNLESTTYDIEDILCICNEIWINKIDNGKLLRVNSFGQIFNSTFYTALTNILMPETYSVVESIGINDNQFSKLIYNFIKEKNNNCEFNCHNFKIYDLFNNIFEFLYENNTLTKLSKSKLEQIKYILMINYLENQKVNIDNIAKEDFTSNVDQNIYYEQIFEYILNCPIINESERNILMRRFGLETPESDTLRVIAKECGISKTRISQIEESALKKLKHSKLKSLTKTYI